MLKRFLQDIGADEEYTKTHWTSGFGQIEQQLMNYPEENARKFASIAMLLGYVAFADLKISRGEAEFLKNILQEDMGLKVSEALVVSQLALDESFCSSADISRVMVFLNQNCDRQDKIRILHTCFQIAVYDGIVPEETKILTKLANSLGFKHEEFQRLAKDYNRYKRDSSV